MENMICWLLGHRPSEVYSDCDYANGESPTFHCLRCRRWEEGDDRNILVRAWHFIRYF